MAKRGFRLAAPEGNDVGLIVERALASGAAFELGSLLVVNGSGEYAECGADPASIAAVSIGAAGSDTSGFNILAKKEFPSGRMQGINLRNRRFRAEYTGSLPAADGGDYGVVRDADGIWIVDFGDVANIAVKLVGRFTDSPESGKDVLVEFLDGVIQPN